MTILTEGPSLKLLCLSAASVVFLAACSDSNPPSTFVVPASEISTPETVPPTAEDQAVLPTETALIEDSGIVVDAVTADGSGTADDSAAAEDSTAADDINDATTDVATAPPNDATQSDISARYTLTFDALWSAETHPTNFPGNPHFSGLVGAVHNEQAVFWGPGQIASNGVEVVAETGGKDVFLDEINFVVGEGRALSAIDGPGVQRSPGQQSVEFEVTRDFPLVTVLTMLAPSPDWVLGVHDLNMIQNGEFVEEMTIELSLYDAGTDSGVGYESPDLDTQPRDTIQLVTSDPADSDFVNGLPLAGRFTIVKE